MCTLMAALGAASSAVSFMGQVQATNAYNAQAAAAHRDARLAATYKYADEQRRMIYNQKNLNQQGYQAAMKGREVTAQGIASAGATGVAGGSVTLDSLIASSLQQTAENEARIQTKREDLGESFRGAVKTQEAEAQQRINSMPFKQGPNPLGLMINIAGAGLQGYNVNPSFSMANIFKVPKFTVQN